MPTEYKKNTGIAKYTVTSWNKMNQEIKPITVSDEIVKFII